METADLEARLASVRTFLNDLGLTAKGDITTPEYWAEVHREIARATGRPVSEADLSDPMSETMVDLFFATPSIARKFLAADLPRLSQVLMALETLPGFPEAPQTIAEVGGGPGIVSLWLAKKFPKARITVFDQSEKALCVGKTWAKQLGVTNIAYERTSYAALSRTTPEKPFDWVLGLGALNLRVDTPHLSADRDPDEPASAILKPMHDFTKACRALLAPSGLLYFSQGSFNDLGLLCLFDAFRKHDLGINWSHSQALGDGDGAGFSIKAMHLFAQPGLASVFTGPREDLSTFLFAAKMARFSDKIILGHGDFEAWLGLLSGGSKLADIRAAKAGGRTERFTVYVKSGMLGFFSSHSVGGRSGFVYNAASFESTVNRLALIVRKYREQNVTLTRTDWHPYFHPDADDGATVPC